MTVAAFARNHQYTTRDTSTFTDRGAVAQSVLTELRLRAEKYESTLRSCWICNPAHTHFLVEPWGEWVLLCFECGRFFFEGVDISTHYDDDIDQMEVPC